MTGLTDGEYLISSVALSIDEYYAGVGESPGVWSGRWAEQLGLSGVVEADQLRNLVEGRHPESGEELLAGNRPRSVRAFDLTFSAPKSASLLWALGTDRVAEVVAAAHREAVDEALGFLEERTALARMQTQGVRRRVATNGWVVAGFVHRTSREGDPQLHTHCLVPNLVCRRGDGRMVAFDAGPLFDWARAAGSIYQNHLQRALSLRLGVVWGPDCHNTREMEGFTRSQLRTFSKRSVQIEAEMEAKGATYESPALRMRADDKASLATRGAKDHSLTPTLLADRWHTESDEVALVREEELEQAVCWRDPRLAGPSWEEITGSLVDPDSGLCAHSARFSEADVIEQICALSGGRFAGEEVTALAQRFLASDLVVRLTPDTDGRRKPAQWSTAAHRALEDRTLELIDTLARRPTAPVDPAKVRSALDGAGRLGDDQVAAIEVLTGEGGSLRAVLAPAGFGKTTMLHAAARVVASEGRPVVAVATTAKAVAELAGVGVDARTIARLRRDLASESLVPGTVVVLDEISQTPTDQVETVLAAVEACPGGSLWVLGDPRQSQPVGAGGVADHLEGLAADGKVPSAQLTVNRRQTDADDQEALNLLRSGRALESQELRAERGWEHEHPTPEQTRTAMADAVCADIDRHGARQVAALVVSHGDAEDLADRIRARLTATGAVSGPPMVGPGWTTERDYRAGDRVLLHARYGSPASLLVNGTTATVVAVQADGLSVVTDRGATATLPATFVQGSRHDGSPNLSHAWARTVDGAQGGTWETCHLLGSSALDAYRGYTGQSRSRQPTHTWNTARLVTVDHGGVLADQRDGAEQVAQALARQPDPTMAARSDPWTVDRRLRERISEHERALAQQPVRAGEGWRHDDLARLRHELEHHWLGVVTSCVRADDPLAYGIDKLRHARTTTITELRRLDQATPADRRDEWNRTRQQLPGVIRDRNDAEQNLSASRAAREDASRRRWGRRDQQAIAAAQAQVDVAERAVKQAEEAERSLRNQLAGISEHQEHRRQKITENAAKRPRLERDLEQFDAALDHTRPDRVRALAQDPPDYLAEPLGPPPSSPAGQAVWCHYAQIIEATLDRSHQATPPSVPKQHATRARQEIALADRLLSAEGDTTNPDGWAELAHQATALRNEALRNRKTPTPTSRQALVGQLHDPKLDSAIARPGPEVGL